jgi:peptidoglycan/xylan/chitin deacetylase (PgdA/CDA1 family)
MVTTDESDLADHLDLNWDQISEMRNAGMYFGAHGYSHNWLANLTDEDQSEEIDKSLNMLSAIGVDVSKGWTMAYPYGNYNACTLDLLRSKRYSLAFLKNGGSATLNLDNWYSLVRIETIHLPFD